MKSFLFAAAALLAAASLHGADLLAGRDWKFSKTWNAAGSLTVQADGSLLVENTGGAGSVTVHCAEDEYTVTPGKTYLVTADMECSAPEIKNSLFVALPGARRVRKPELRTPHVSGKQAAMEFTARPDERRMALYLTLSGTGKTVVKAVNIEEITPGGDLIKRPGINWNFVAAPGAKGSLERLPDGSLLLKKESGKAHVMAYLTLPLPIKEGKSYRVTMTGRRSASVARWGLMSHSGSQKSWPSRGADGKAGELEKITLDVESAAGDTGLRIYAVLHSAGELEVGSVVVEELSGRREFLPIKNWTANSDGSGGGAVKLPDGSWKVEKKIDKGNMVFTFHGGPHKVIPGRHYLIEWQVRLAPGQSANSMTYLPRKPKARTPWPCGGIVSSDGTVQTVSQLLAVGEDENSMRLHLVIGGKAGDAVVKGCSVTEMDDEELKKRN